MGSIEVPSNNEGVLRSVGFGGYKEGFEVVVVFGGFTVDVEYVNWWLSAVGGEDSQEVVGDRAVSKAVPLCRDVTLYENGCVVGTLISRVPATLYWTGGVLYGDDVGFFVLGLEEAFQGGSLSAETTTVPLPN